MKTGVIVVLLVLAGGGLIWLLVAGMETGSEVMEGYTTTASGLQFLDEKVGDGTEAKSGNNVEVHYTGTLKNGKKFDSSRDRNEPFSFPLGRGKVIKGWDEGVAGMKEGGKRKLVIPANLGYGERGAPPAIPPNSVLLFDVELLKVH